ncbi:hypothetical protein RhiirA5_427980 [Rhizophagus irregularis]|uniref:Uncharacterized protein n=1 Tax=Rhizophagus irregularis TaxID=588596 RepID=A0A2N0P177_9GLOM|nr:hypothetical protein RhiirA5_427980 [Rhizophagus irregularis]
MGGIGIWDWDGILANGRGFWQKGWDMGWDGIGDSPIPFNMGGKYNRHLNILTASDYRNIMKIALFALNEIFEGNEITCKELCKLYAKFSKMYIMSRKEMYTEEDLKIFEVSQSS